MTVAHLDLPRLPSQPTENWQRKILFPGENKRIEEMDSTLRIYIPPED
jgi:hypothetical protein